MNLKEQLAAAKKKMAELRPRIEADDVSAMDEAESLQEEIKNLEEAIEKAERKSNLLKSIGHKSNSDDVVTASSLGEHFIKNMTLHRNGRHLSASAPNFHLKTITNTSTLVTPSMPGLTTTIDGRIVTEVLPKVGIKDLFGAETITGNALTYYTEGGIVVSDSTNKPYGFDIVAEGGLKPQVSFDDPAVHNESLVKIAAFVKESDEYIEDAPFLASTINGRLLNYLHLFEEQYLLNKLLSTSGIQTDTTSWTSSTTANGLADLLLEAAMDTEDASGFPADYIVMNPKDWWMLRTGKDNSGQYYGGGYFSDTQGKQLWGIPVFTSTFLTKNKQILVGSFKTCASVVTNNSGVSIDITNSNEDDFKYNRMAIRCETRETLAVRRPAGFKLFTRAN